MKKTTTEKLAVDREIVKALLPEQLAPVEGGNEAPRPGAVGRLSTDSVNACCA